RAAGRRPRTRGTAPIPCLHDHSGQLKPLSGTEEEVYKKLRRYGKKKFGWLNNFQDDLAYGRPHNWRCRAGARYLYICEDGLVHYCSQQRGYPAIPLEEYTLEHIAREFNNEKPCAKYCTIACVQQVAMMDNWRSPQQSSEEPEAFSRTPEKVNL
ncbi:MAG: radical SAM protein, partial [Acidobacteriota bacterium]